MSATNNLPTLSLEAAKIASEAAQEKAKEMGIGMLLSAIHSPTLLEKKTLPTAQSIKQNNSIVSILEHSAIIVITPNQTKLNPSPKQNKN